VYPCCVPLLPASAPRDQHVCDSVVLADPPLEEDTKLQVEMDLPWQLQYSWQDMVRVWRNVRTGETIGPPGDRRLTPMTKPVSCLHGIELVCVLLSPGLRACAVTLHLLRVAYWLIVFACRLPPESLWKALSASKCTRTRRRCCLESRKSFTTSSRCATTLSSCRCARYGSLHCAVRTRVA
jgi:hypothetical protein